MEPGSVENLCVVYRSRDFLVVNKHWDVRIDSKAWWETLTLQKQLRHRFPELADPDTCYGFRFCHQLDFSTSGALCVALNKAAAGSAYKCFKDRQVTKAYLALAARTQNQASRSWWSWNMGCMQVILSPKCCCSLSQAGRTSCVCTAAPSATPSWGT
ncbi:RNA pseudouridylate synthase domain-containing protein 1 isoform X5 [Hippopotamus amphibius kiboko]|uniref:RNA pseudouridylate synthase domain-containing protein 1 isoform X5 n=1 Tax=Hippopotamus amphibius kiboko TaxID=575201 RepID=UPI0025958F56|nr:RNA pseudouridylate synthase domain-containing protein 1 isoform X5 [Hippopotamus amphibius kiboko]